MMVGEISAHSLTHMCLNLLPKLYVPRRPLCRGQLVDWVRLSELTPGLRWMMSCPLTCSSSSSSSSSCCRVMGASVVAGCSASPSLDADWLRSWSCEMAHTVAHCSVQVMEVRWLLAVFDSSSG